MNKQIKRVAVISLALLLVSVSSVSALYSQQTPETRANRLVEIAEDTSQTVGDFIDLVYSNVTILEMIDDAGFTSELEGNVTLYDEGVENVTNAVECLENEDYECAIANATEALSIFREAYKSIHIILYNSDVKISPFLIVDELGDAIDRSIVRVGELKVLISTEATIYTKLSEAEGLLTEAKDVLLPDNIEDAKTNLREANILISEVCQYLKQVAQELNPQRIRDYCEGAYQYRERFRERFGQAGTEGFDVNGFLQEYGYQNEGDFMARFQEMIQNAQGTEDVENALEDLQEIGKLIHEINQNFTQEMGHYRAQHGQTGSTGGYGQEVNNSGYTQFGSDNGYGQENNGSGYIGSSGPGQMGFGAGQ
jgi:predicted RNase H-like HicB family nuclease